MSNENMANYVTDVPSAIAELLAANKRLEQELESRLEQSVDISVVNELNETIEKQKKEIEIYKALYEMACDTSEAWKMRHEALCGFEPPELYLHLKSLEETIKAKDAEIERLKVAISDNQNIALENIRENQKQNKAIKEAKKILEISLPDFKWFTEGGLDDYRPKRIERYEKAKAWLESNK